MDLVKIGKYIAGKRKGLGLTQRQLADKLGMSDKSVSKWERGVCLPDVALYSDLCGILGISINEFLAGEDIPQESVVQKSEENIIGVATASKHRQKKLKSVICILLAVSIVALSVIGAMLIKEHWPQNCIYPIDRDSTEMKTAGMLSQDGAFIYDFKTSDKYKSLTLYCTEYRSGKLVSKETVGSFGYVGFDSPKIGQLIFVPDFEHSTVKFLVVDADSKMSADIPILKGVDKTAISWRSGVEIYEETPVRYDNEQGIVALIYGKRSFTTVAIEDFENNTAPANDYVYYFSVEFGK